MPFARRLAILLLLAAVAASPLASAQSGQVSADGVSYSGGAKQRGQAVAYYLVDGDRPTEGLLDPSGPSAQAGQAAVVGLDVRAQRIEALVMEQHVLLLADDKVRYDDPREDASPTPQRVVLEQASAALVAQQEAFQVHVLPADASAAMPFTARGEAGRFEAYETLAMGSGKFRHPNPADAQDARAADKPSFWDVVFSQPLVVNTDEGARQDVTFTGDLVVEILGLTLEASGQGSQATLESGVWTTDTVPGALQEQRRSFVRLYLTDATLRITAQGGDPDLHFAGPEVVSEQEGDSILLGVTGPLLRDGQAEDLSDERVLLPAGSTLTLAPGADGRMAMSVAPTAVAAGEAGRDLTPGGRGGWVAVAAVLALAVALGIGLARRLAGPADLRAVEAAIEAQRYGRAARIAKRVLRISPGLEDAVLGRAIALSKAGRAGAAIAELHEHLAARGATDGSLHYVLGLAFLDVGRVADAQAALQEAVRLTPALAGEVAARLGPQGSSRANPTPGREVHGYA